MGAERVDLYDINAYAYHMLQLKFAALKIFKNEEKFINFFLNQSLDFTNDEKIFSFNTYKNEIRKELPTYTKNFWDQVYKLLKSGKNITDSKLIINTYSDSKILKTQLNYLENNNYSILRERLHKLDEKNMDYHNTSVINLPKKLNRTYDLILLSNIQAYVQSMYNGNFEEALKKYRDFIDMYLSKFIKDNGKIASEYYYLYDAYYCPENNEKFTKIEIESYYGIINGIKLDSKDAVMLYQKKK